MEQNFIHKIKPLIPLVITLQLQRSIEFILKQFLEYNFGSILTKIILYFVAPILFYSIINQISNYIINKIFGDKIKVNQSK
jgi:hypothetical protein